MFDGEYRVNKESMEKLLYELNHPSLEDAVKREEQLKEIREHMKVFRNGNQTVVHYDDFDLSFLYK